MPSETRAIEPTGFVSESESVLRALREFFSQRLSIITPEVEHLIQAKTSVDFGDILPLLDPYGHAITRRLGASKRPIVVSSASNLTWEDVRESQLIGIRRELASAKRRAEYLEAQNEHQLKQVSDLSQANRYLTEALVGSRSGDIRILDKRSGRVTRVHDDCAEVTYDTPDGPVEHVYDKDQFVDGKLPDEGDWVEAHAFVTFRPGSVRKVTEDRPPSEEEDEFRAFRTKRKKGPIVFRDPAD